MHPSNEPQVLQGAPYPAYFLEMPPVSSQCLDRPFYFVIVASTALEGITEADPAPFRQHIQPSCSSSSRPSARAAAAEPSGEAGVSAADADVVVFPNLRKDAILVVPCQAVDAELAVYPHIAAFMRSAPPPQVHRLWQVLSNAF